MFDLIKKNLGFFIPVFVFFVLSISLSYFLEKGELILFFNERRSQFWNLFFSVATKIGEEYVYVLLLLALSLKKIRYAICIPIIAFCVSFGSYGLKDYFLNLRPKDYFLKIDEWGEIIPIPGVELLTGPTSFPSGHTMSAFALYTFIALIFNKNIASDLLLFLLAALIGISRIYLVQHFLIDVIAGTYCGILIGILTYFLQSRLKSLNIDFLERNLNIFNKNKEIV